MRTGNNVDLLAVGRDSQPARIWYFPGHFLSRCIEVRKMDMSEILVLRERVGIHIVVCPIVPSSESGDPEGLAVSSYFHAVEIAARLKPWDGGEVYGIHYLVRRKINSLESWLPF